MATEQKDGGPAFPEFRPRYGDYSEVRQRGMTLRDYFAAIPLELGTEGLSKESAEVLMGEPMPKYSTETGWGAIMKWWLDAESKYRYLRADAMLAAAKENHNEPR